MYDFLKVGQEVTFSGLIDIKLIVAAVNEARGTAQCKYYDDNLKRYIKITVPAAELVPVRRPGRAPVTLLAKKITMPR